ncbi:hypothetical protein [Phytohabitans rumicis]|uniref:hypothetical protein n=1 Tax=Phytohabitans rumicis TaxID=1076125 RepID=UPI0031E8FA42
MTFFLSAMDPRAKVKGSRDGLGAQGVWAAAGRPLIGNLTTVTSSLRGFTTLLVGLRLAAQTAADDAADSAANAFLVWEQMVGYARHVVHEHRGFFGYQRVAARTAAAKADGGRVRLSAHSGEQILGNQRTDGLLGNYTAPARVSGLVRPGFPVRLTPEAAAFVDDVYMPRLAQAWGREARDLVRALGQDSVSFDVRPNQRLAAVASLFDAGLGAAEARFYQRHLVQGGPSDPTSGRQVRFAAILGARLAESEQLSQAVIAQLAADADEGGWGDVAGLLRNIGACESVLAPATTLFSYLLGRDGDRVEAIAADVRKAWGGRLDSVHPEALSVLPAGDWRAIATSLDHGDYAGAVTALVGRNAAVMSARGGAAPWLDISNGRVRVQFRGDEAGSLLDADEVRQLWWYPYFIPSLRSILTTLQKGRP